jgi:hypothetical protein
MVAGPGVIGIAQSHAILGIGPDIFDLFGDDNKSDLHHPRPGTEVSAQSFRSADAVAAAEAPTAKIGSLPESANVHSFAAAENVGIPESGGGSGGGGLPRTNTVVRPGNLARISTAPVTRSIVIRGVPGAADAAAEVPAPVPRTPAFVPLAAPLPVEPEPAGRPAPAAPPARSPSAPPAKDPLAPGDSGSAQFPDSYRVGYAEYLRAATTSDLFVAAVPGVAGIAGFTLVGAYAGYRQAKALQRALLAPVPTSFLL